MSDERGAFEIARLVFTALGAAAASLAIGGRIATAFLAQRALEMEARLLEKMGDRVMAKEMVKVQLLDIRRRVETLERWRERLNGRGGPL